MRSILLAAALILGLSGSARAVSPSYTDWPNYHGDVQLNSSTTYSGFAKPFLVWSADLGYASEAVHPFHTSNTPTIDSGGKLIVNTSTAIWALTLSSGGVVWKTTFTANGLTQPAIDFAGIYTSSANSVIAISTINGSILWQYSPVGYTGARDFLTAGSGITINRFEDPSAVVSNGLDLFVGNKNDDTTLSNGISNAAIFRIRTNGMVGVNPPYTETASKFDFGQPSFSRDGQFLYFKASGGTNSMYGLDVSAGLRKWGPVISGTPCAVSGGTTTFSNGAAVFTFDTSNKVVAVESKTGGTLWSSAQAFMANQYSCTPAYDVNANELYVVGNVGGTVSLYAINANTGATAWSVALGIDTGAPLQFGFPTIASPGTVYIAGAVNGNWKLFNVDSTGHSLRWSASYGNIIATDVATPQVLVSTGIVAIHTAVRDSGSNSTALRGHHFVHVLAISNYTTLAVSSTQFSQSGSNLISTITVRVADAGATAVKNAFVLSPTAVSGDPAAGINPSGLDLLTDLSGNTTYQVQWNFSSIAHANYQAMSTTVTASIPGLGPVSLVLNSVIASTFTISFSTPSIEDSGTDITRVTTVTFTVSNSTGGRVPGHPVVLDAQSYLFASGSCMTSPAPVSPGNALSGTYQLTNSTGQATFIYRVRMAVGSGNSLTECIPYADFQNLPLPLKGYALGLPPVTIDARDARPSTFTGSGEAEHACAEAAGALNRRLIEQRCQGDARFGVLRKQVSVGIDRRHRAAEGHADRGNRRHGDLVRAQEVRFDRYGRCSDRDVRSEDRIGRLVIVKVVEGC